jgi:FixJ family two-component response regulator
LTLLCAVQECPAAVNTETKFWRDECTAVDTDFGRTLLDEVPSEPAGSHPLKLTPDCAEIVSRRSLRVADHKRIPARPSRNRLNDCRTRPLSATARRLVGAELWDLGSYARGDAMIEQKPTVFIIDDDPSIRQGVADLLRSVGLQVETFGSPQDFINSKRPDAPGCLILDVRLPGASGLELQRLLTSSDIPLPIIFISGYGDISVSVRAIKSGAIEFLTKPLNEQQLLDAVHAGIGRDRVRREEAKAVTELRQRYDTLTPREREILLLVVSDQANKQIAAHLGLSEMTVKVHRSQVMHKMRAKSLIDLVRIADKLGLVTYKG